MSLLKNLVQFQRLCVWLIDDWFCRRSSGFSRGASMYRGVTRYTHHTHTHVFSFFCIPANFINHIKRERLCNPSIHQSNLSPYQSLVCKLKTELCNWWLYPYFASKHPRVLIVPINMFYVGFDSLEIMNMVQKRKHILYNQSIRVNILTNSSILILTHVIIGFWMLSSSLGYWRLNSHLVVKRIIVHISE